MREFLLKTEYVRPVCITKSRRPFEYRGCVLLRQNNKGIMHTSEKKEHRSLLSYRWLIFSTLAIGYALVYFHRVAPAMVAPELTKSFAIKGAALGALASAYFYPYALMQLPSGLLSDSLGPKKTVTIFTLIAALGAILFGLSPTFSAAILGRTMIGLGTAALFIPTLKILANWFEKERFAMVTGFLMAIGGIGWLSAATPLVFLTLWVGWRTSFIIMGCFSLVLAVLTYLIVKDRPSRILSPKNSQSEVSSLSFSGRKRLSLSMGVKIVLSDKKFWPLAIWFFCTGGILFGFGGLWAGPYLAQVYNLNITQTGNILMMIAVGMIVGSPLLGYLSEKVFRGRKPVLLMSSSVIIGIWVLLVFCTDGLSIPGLYVLFILFGIFASGIKAIGFTVAKELFPVQIAGTSTGIANIFPFAGAALFQPLIGLVLDHSGRLTTYPAQAYRLAFMGFLAAAILALISALFLRETFSYHFQSQTNQEGA